VRFGGGRCCSSKEGSSSWSVPKSNNPQRDPTSGSDVPLAFLTRLSIQGGPWSATGPRPGVAMDDTDNRLPIGDRGPTLLDALTYRGRGLALASGPPSEPSLRAVVVLLATAPGGLDGRSDRSGTGSAGESTRFGVVLPVHNEQQLLPAALAALDRTISHASSGRMATIGVAIVLDGCSDRSGDIAEDWRGRAMHPPGRCQIEIVESNFRRVGEARRMGCQLLLQRWSDVETGSIWLATTDADSEVPQDWISAQLRMRREGSQVWIGPVAVRDWCGRTPGTSEAWRHQYQTECLPVHGANFGIDGATYLEAGGFQGLSTGEDRALFDEVIALGAVIRHDPKIQVTTSGRREARAPCGFAHALTSIEATINPSVADEGSSPLHEAYFRLLHTGWERI